ncbi:RnfABCDGE type electron transport complex subunit D [Methylophaga sp.]|uniref:RnfABCDGE type electron transport complex subunit D n=1 Tax=Methylophaga sp. TaxID=2024840 RepID=UPI00271F5B69|nr:RnfABCDGE type electron transport complex subunit D [Methylophaga sp.]MDO8828047.1 RnfABCDGE type electron transport complex subunit D [Methylophaga sp.]
MKVQPIIGPHTGVKSHVSDIMLQVIFALIPATLFGLYFFGWPAINLFVITLVSAVVFEFLCLRLADKPTITLRDNSALLTGWLLAMTLPPWAPWWIGVVGAGISIILGKHVFGGLGQNVFNPAMLARVALLISFPVEMTTWANVTPLFTSQAPDFIQGLQITFMGLGQPDAYTGATVMGHVKTELLQDRLLPESLNGMYQQPQAWLGFMPGSLGETSALLLALGGVWLLYKGVIKWQIPFAVLSAVFVFASVFHWIDPQHYLSPWIHLSSGALILTAFFIATDYVTSPNSAVGQLVFGFSCGGLIFIIRTWGGYPEGAGFAVLLMNAMTPLIDHYIKPRIYGRNRKGLPLESEQ